MTRRTIEELEALFGPKPGDEDYKPPPPLPPRPARAKKVRRYRSNGGKPSKRAIYEAIMAQSLKNLGG